MERRWPHAEKANLSVFRFRGSCRTARRRGAHGRRFKADHRRGGKEQRGAGSALGFFSRTRSSSGHGRLFDFHALRPLRLFILLRTRGGGRCARKARMAPKCPPRSRNWQYAEYVPHIGFLCRRYGGYPFRRPRLQPLRRRRGKELIQTAGRRPFGGHVGQRIHPADAPLVRSKRDGRAFPVRAAVSDFLFGARRAERRDRSFI